MYVNTTLFVYEIFLSSSLCLSLLVETPSSAGPSGVFITTRRGMASSPAEEVYDPYVGFNLSPLPPTNGHPQAPTEEPLLYSFVLCPP